MWKETSGRQEPYRFRDCVRKRNMAGNCVQTSENWAASKWTMVFWQQHFERESGRPSAQARRLGRPQARPPIDGLQRVAGLSLNGEMSILADRQAAVAYQGCLGSIEGNVSEARGRSATAQGPAPAAWRR